jgi:hypothetical protein
MARSRSKKQLARTAHHEAGHAVIALREGRRFKHVTIVADEESFGHILYERWRNYNPEYNQRPTTLVRIDKDILCSLAGPAATRRFAGRHDWRGASGDLGRVVDLACCIHGGLDVVEPYVAYMRARAKRAVDHHWEFIEAVAANLLLRSRLTFDEVRQTIHETMSTIVDREPQKK